MPYVDVAKSRIYYESHGPGPEASKSAPALVLLHGVGGNHASWFHQVTHWRAHYRVLILDARGFGNSTDTEQLGQAAFVSDVEAVLKDAGVERCILIGQSMGGGTALSFTCRWPERVLALVLADTLFGLTLSAALRESLEALTATNARLTQLERVLGARYPEKKPAMATLYTTLASFNAVNVRTLKGGPPMHSPAELAATGVPVLFLVGEGDVLFPPSLVHPAQQLVTGSHYVELPGAGHSAYFETPELFNQAILTWLGKIGVAMG